MSEWEPYTFAPKEDITTMELALIMWEMNLCVEDRSIIFFKKGDKTGLNQPQLFRHFVRVKV